MAFDRKGQRSIQVVKVQLEGYKNNCIRTLGSIVRLKLPRDEDAVFAYLFCTKDQIKSTNFLPRGQNLKKYQGYLSAPYKCSEVKI